MIRRVPLTYRGVAWIVCFNDETGYASSISLPQAPQVELLTFLELSVLEEIEAALPRDQRKCPE